MRVDTESTRWRTRVFHVSPRFRTCIYVCWAEGKREKETEKHRDTLSPGCSRDDGSAQSFTDPLSLTRVLLVRAHIYKCTHALACRFDFPMQFFPSGEMRANSHRRRTTVSHLFSAREVRYKTAAEICSFFRTFVRFAR